MWWTLKTIWTFALAKTKYQGLDVIFHPKQLQIGQNIWNNHFQSSHNRNTVYEPQVGGKIKGTLWLLWFLPGSTLDLWTTYSVASDLCGLAEFWTRDRWMESSGYERSTNKEELQTFGLEGLIIVSEGKEMWKKEIWLSLKYVFLR